MDLLNRRSRGFLPLLTLFAALGGCDLVRDPTRVGGGEPLVVVHAVLEAGTDTVRVLLESSEPARGSRPAGVWPISGAQLRIGAEGAAGVVLAEAPAGFPGCRYSRSPETESRAGCYAGVLASPVRAGGRYTLGITLPDGRAVTAEVRVPGEPEILAPVTGTRILVARRPDAEWFYGRVPLRLALGAETGAVQAYLEIETMYLGGQSASGACVSYGVQRLSAADTLTLGISGALHCTVGLGSSARIVDPDSALARLHVIAYDSAYARYERALSENTVRSESLMLGSRGVYGVFAAGARASLPVMLVQER